MAWQRNDDQYGVSRKVTRLNRRTRLAAVGLDQLAKNYSARALTDGVLDATELEEVLATTALIRELVRVEMWHEGGHKCDRCVQPSAGGIVIHDYLDYNPSRAQVEAQREAERVRKASQRDTKRTTGGTPTGREHPGPGPVPTIEKTDIARAPKSSLVGDAPTSKAEITDVVYGMLVKASGPMSRAGAEELAAALCARARRPVDDVNAYVATVCHKSPSRVVHDYERLDLEVTAA